jgi:hypothetical protein
MTDKQKILQIEISNIVDKMTNGLMHPITGKQMLYESSIKALTLTDVSQQSELLKVLEYTRQIKSNPKDIQLIVDKLYVENL